MSSNIKPISKQVTVGFQDSIKIGVGVAIGFFVFFSLILPAILCAGWVGLIAVGYNIGG